MIWFVQLHICNNKNTEIVKSMFQLQRVEMHTAYHLSGLLFNFSCSIAKEISPEFPGINCLYLTYVSHILDILMFIFLEL
jgi:hypothetical protein